MKQSLTTLGKGLVTLALTLAQLSPASGDQSALYDNFSLLIQTEENSFGPPHNRGASAQLFTTGQTGAISSVTVIMGRKGNPGGVVSVEIWDQIGQIPGNKVADVGQIDLTTLAPLSEGGDTFVFTPAISDLAPDTPYYLLFENTNATIPDEENTYGQFFASSTEGSGDSAQLIVRPTPGEWISIADPAERWILKITESENSFAGPNRTRSLYNNLPVRSGTSKDWVSPTHNRGRSAQQFMTGAHGLVSSISFATGAIGNPTGTMSLEIWDDDSGQPGSKVADVGLIDLESLAPFGEGGEILHYDRLIDGLEPNSPYYLVRIAAGAQVDSDNTFARYVVNHSEGAKGASQLMFKPNEWRLSLPATYAVLQIIEESDEGLVSLYDNFPTPDASSKHWIFPTHNRGASAQPFRTGELGLVSTVSLTLGAVGSPSGTVSVELWDDEGGLPGSKVADIGEIDLATLAPVASGGVFLTFQNPITDLQPNASYYLIRDNTKALIDGNNTFHSYVLDGTEGFLRGAGELFLKPDGWVPAKDLVSNLGLSSVHAVIDITESTADLPEENMKILSVQRSDGANLVHLRVRPHHVYILEYSESLEPGSWIEIDDNISSSDSEYTFDDRDPVRLNATRGYYRLRLP